jgi:hypothetical protein
VTLRDGAPCPSLFLPKGTERPRLPPVRGLFFWAAVLPNSFRRVSSSLHWAQEVAFLISTGVEGGGLSPSAASLPFVTRTAMDWQMTLAEGLTFGVLMPVGFFLVMYGVVRIIELFARSS